MKPVAEVLVEGELSPFEHETLYKVLRKKLQVDQPSYVELPDEDLATRVNITIHHPYTIEIFTLVLQESWRDLKDLLKQIRHRRGKAGAAFNIAFVGKETRLVFRSGALNTDETTSALDQIGHLTSIVHQMVRPEGMAEPLQLIECSFDTTSDRWHDFRGFSTTNEKNAYGFDETAFKWTLLETR